MASTPTSNPDDALLARLDALRTSSVSLSNAQTPLPIPEKVETTETTLSSRLKALRTASEASVSSVPRPSSPPPTPAPISPPTKGANNGDTMGRYPKPGIPNPPFDHAPVRPAPPATRNSANAIFREARRQAEALQESIRGAKFGSEGDESKMVRDARRASKAVEEEVVRQESVERGYEGRWRREDRDRDQDQKKKKRLKDDTKRAVEKARKTIAAREAGDRATSDEETSSKESNSDAERRRQRLKELGIDTDDEIDRDVDAEADAILAEMMDDVGLDFEEDAKKGLFQQDSPPKLTPPPTLLTPLSPGEMGDDEKEDEGAEEADDGFHAAMKARMSALRSPSPQHQPSTGLDLPSAPSTQPVDSLGLPSAPTSKVEISRTGTATQPAREDYICKICYAPATVFCEGCEEDFEEWDTREDAMFCARCWKEVHLGEDAGDERKHEWAPVRRGK